jgi:hypothetical protein
MGGGNAQKSAAARERNMKDKGKTDEERKAASAKATKDSQAFVCALCRMTFMINVKPPTLLLHVTAKHPKDTNPVECFPQLAGYDPNPAKAAPVAAAAIKPKKKKADDGLDMLSAGLKPKKK